MKKTLTLAFTLIILGLSATKANAQCTANFNFTPDPSNNGDVTYTNTSSAGTGLYYSWDFGDGAQSNLMNPPIHNYIYGGTFNVCLTIYDSLGLYDSMGLFGGCYNTFCNSVTVLNTSATCNAMFYSYNDTASGGITFANNSVGSITDYLWDFGDGTTSTLAYPGNHFYASGGIYHVCLTTTNPATLCNSNYCDSVFISSCITSFTYAADAIGNGCTFNGASTGTTINYSWDFGDGSTSTLQNPYHIFAANGGYTVCLTASSPTDSTCHSSLCHYITMSGVCSALFTIVHDTTTLGSYWVYDYSTSPGTISYLWDFGDGSTSTLTYPTHTYATSGPFQICLTVSDGLGCTDMHCDSIGAGHSMSGPITLTVLAAGVHEQANNISSLENYPNPFGDNTTISYSINHDSKVELTIVDLVGNKIAIIETGNKSTGNYTTTWNSEGVAEGMYLLQLKVNNNISTKKLIINR